MITGRVSELIIVFYASIYRCYKFQLQVNTWNGKFHKGGLLILSDYLIKNVYIYCHFDLFKLISHRTDTWIHILPTVLLELRKQHIRWWLSEEFFLQMHKSSQFHSFFFFEKCRQHIKLVLLILATYHHRKVSFVHHDLFTCFHIFPRVEAMRRNPWNHRMKAPTRFSNMVIKIHV